MLKYQKFDDGMLKFPSFINFSLSEIAVFIYIEWINLIIQSEIKMRLLPGTGLETLDTISFT